MNQIWIHTNGEDYWEGAAVCVRLADTPRMGETVYLSQETLETLLEQAGEGGDASVRDGALSFRDNLTVVDVCHVEGDDSTHVMVDFPIGRGRRQ